MSYGYTAYLIKIMLLKHCNHIIIINMYNRKSPYNGIKLNILNNKSETFDTFPGLPVLVQALQCTKKKFVYIIYIGLQF